MDAYKQFKSSTGQTPQTEPIPATQQIRNSAGGYSFEVGIWERLKRFLILGAEGNSYYSTERQLVMENANSVIVCIGEDGLRVVRETVAVSDAGRAPKNDPAIFVLALCATYGDDATRRAALDALPLVCRTGTHLFQFAEVVQTLRGWGRGLRRAVASWYGALTPRDLAYQVVKYRQRNGWTHTDLLRLSHPKPNGDARGAIFQWVAARYEDGQIVKGENAERGAKRATKQAQSAWARELTAPADEALALVWAFERAQTATQLHTIIHLIDTYDLPREALPTQWLNEPAVWDRLLQNMPMTAMIRNLGVMSKIGLLAPMSAAETLIVERLSDEKRLHKARIHPIAVLSALRTYAGGKGVRGSGVWTPTPRVIDALDEAFYKAFENVEPANKRMMLALDVSGSMAGGEIAGVPGLTPRDASAALALVTARTEKQYTITAFQAQMTPINLSPRMRLDDAIKAVSGLSFGATDCAQPMLYALEKKINVDTFVVLTDSETWAGKIHPIQALNQYRQRTSIAAQLIVVGMLANPFSIADSNDGGMLDVVGMDSSTPQLISDFARRAF